MRLLGLSRGWPRLLNRGENYNAEMEFRDFDNRLLNAGSTVTVFKKISNGALSFPTALH